MTKKNEDRFDQTDWYFTKIISIVIAALYIFKTYKDGTPFYVTSLIKGESIFGITLKIPEFRSVVQLSLIMMALVILLQVYAAWQLHAGRSKASMICDATASIIALVTMGTLILSVYRYMFEPTPRMALFPLYLGAMLYFLISAGAIIYKFVKNDVKLSKLYFLPAVIVSIASLGLVIGQVNYLRIPQSYDMYRADKFEDCDTVPIGIDNNFRGAVSSDGDLFFVAKMSDGGYGILKTDGSGDYVTLDQAAYIPVCNLVSDGERLFYLKYTEEWGGIDRPLEWSEGCGYFTLCVMDISSEEITEYESKSFPDGLGERLFCSSLVGIRDGRLFFIAGNPENGTRFDVYTISVADGDPDVSSVVRYAWGCSTGTRFIDYGSMESFYNGLILNHDDFWWIEYNGTRYAYDEYAREAQELINFSGHWENPYDQWIRQANDFNFYDGTIYYLIYNRPDNTYSIFRGTSISEAELYATVPAPGTDPLDSIDARILISDSYVVLTDDAGCVTVALDQ